MTATYPPRTAQAVKPASSRQLAELRNVYGYTGIVCSHAEAQKLLTERRKIAEQGVVTAWQVGEKQLLLGYIVEAMPEPYCYRVIRPKAVTNPDGPTVAYNVCLCPGSGLCPCDCPDATRHADTEHVCKHQLAARVQLWQWAQDSDDPTIYTDYLTNAGVIALRSTTTKGPGAGKSTPTHCAELQSPA